MLRHSVARRFATLGAIGAIVATQVLASVGPVSAAGPETFNATLSGGSETPPAAGGGSGNATVTIAADELSIGYTVNYSGLSGAVVAAHIHIGAVGVAGPIILPLAVGPTPLTGTLTATDLKAAGGVTTFTGALAAIRAGGTYVNLHTAANPGGEIRGQLNGPETFAATLNGAYEVPLVKGNGIGFATIVISPDATSISYSVTYDGLSGPVVAAHIHVGSLAVAGPIILPLTIGPSPMTGTLTTADLNVAGGVTTFAEAIAAMRAGTTYVNLHTAAHPGGEIRGQLVPAANIPQFTILVDSPQSVPSGHFWEFNDYFPRSATVANGTTISFTIQGFHTATLLPAGMTQAQDNATAGVVARDADDTMPNPNGTTHIVFNFGALAPVGPTPTCGTILEPCVFDGSKPVSSGVPMAPSTPPFAVKINAPAGSYIFHCRVHPWMQASLTVLAAGATAVTTVQGAAVATATQLAADVAAGTAAENASSAAAVKTNASGTKTYTLRAGTSTRDGHVSILEFLPHNANIRKGDTVVWRSLDVNEPHTITFPKDLSTEMLILCEGPVGDTPAKPTKNPPTGPQDFACPGGGFPEIEIGGGNGVSKVTSPKSVSDSGLVAYRTIAAGFGLPATAFRSSWTVSFKNAAAGVYQYVCQIHEGMVATITVKK